MRSLALAFFTVLLSAPLFWPSVARANCAAPVTYELTATAEGVRVCPENFSGRCCPDAGGLLRENATTGAVVKLAAACTPSEGGACDSCFLDTCLEPGTYRYGFATPYECASSSCGTDYFAQISVAEAKVSCSPAHEAFAGTVPWKGSDASICGYGGGSSCTSLGGPAVSVLAINGVLLSLGLALGLRRRARPVQ